MLTTMDVTTRVAFTRVVDRFVTFGLNNSEYIIKLIDGLGPVKAEYTTVGSATDAGGLNLDPRDVQRNIVVTFGFAPKRGTGNTVESLRQALYAFLMPKKQVELGFTNDVTGRWLIKGAVETHEPDIFSKDPQVQVSILCGDPYFYKDAPDVVYQIPFIDSGTSASEYFVLPYENDVPVGFVYEGNLRLSSSFLRLFMNAFPSNTLPPEGVAELWQARFEIDYQFAVNDFLRISSVRGDRGAWRFIGGNMNSKMSLMPYFSGSLVNMQLHPNGPINFRNVPTNYSGNSHGRPLVNGGVIRYKRATGGL